MDETPTPKRRGRKPLAPEDRKREVVGFRMRTELKEGLERVASTMGRSLSEQLEMMIESVPEFQRREKVLSDYNKGLKGQNKLLTDLNEINTCGLKEIIKTNDAMRWQTVYLFRYILSVVKENISENNESIVKEILSIIEQIESSLSEVITKEDIDAHFALLAERRRKGLSLLDPT